MTDAQALKLAMERASRDPEMADYLQRKLDGTRISDGKGWACPPEKWEAVAESAAYSCQIKALKLKPWEDPPCFADGAGDGPADILLRKMLAAKISRWHPDPFAELEAELGES
jgi:hypothetical protein